jgi:hypothetical protein
MRLLLYLLIFLTCLPNLVLGQDLFVVHLKGDIYNQTQKSALATGTMVSSDDELIFREAGSVAVVLSVSEGRMVLNGQDLEKNEDGEFLSIAKNVLLPLKSNLKMSTRGGDDEQIANLKDFFGTDRYAIIGDKLALPISPAKYPLNENFKMVARYTINQKEKNTYLTHQNNTLILDKTVLLADVETNPEEATFGDLSIYYLDVAREYPNKLVTFLPVFIDEDRLIEELNNYINIMESAGLADGEDMELNLFSFVNDVYGTINEDLFFDWLYEQDDINF